MSQKETHFLRQDKYEITKCCRFLVFKKKKEIKIDLPEIFASNWIPISGIWWSNEFENGSIVSENSFDDVLCIVVFMIGIVMLACERRQSMFVQVVFVGVLLFVINWSLFWLFIYNVFSVVVVVFDAAAAAASSWYPRWDNESIWRRHFERD